MIVENAWYVAAWAEEVTTKPLSRRICNLPIVLYRTLGGKVCALIDSCAHRGAPLSLGTVTEDGIRCNYHGVVFGCDGKCTKIPNQENIPEKAKVRSFPIVEKDHAIWLWYGDPVAADESLIVDYPFHDNPKWPSRFAISEVASSYLLIGDNLLDATHLAYVHGSSVGGSDPNVHMTAESSLKPTERGHRFERLMRNAPPPPAYSGCVPDLPEKIDRWQEFDFVAPSTVLQYSGGVPTGADRAEVGAPRFDMRIFHSATPATDNTCYYFWSVQNGHDVDKPESTEVIYDQIAKAIVEDKLVIEAQQEKVDELGEARFFDNAADAARIMARRAIKKYARQHAPADAKA